MILMKILMKIILCRGPERTDPWNGIEMFLPLFGLPFFVWTIRILGSAPPRLTGSTKN
jgi:hypothetical protein